MTNSTAIFESMASAVRINFEKNIGEVRSLVNFDSIVIEFALSKMTALHEKIKGSNINSMTNGYNEIEALKRVQEHNSLEANYGTIRNQCVVLLVSHFGSTIKELFKGTFDIAARSGRLGDISKETLKTTIDELARLDLNASGTWADFYLDKTEQSFQDMKSIKRLFERAFGFEIVRDKAVDNIILSQAVRHIIVHGGGVVDKAMLGQIESAGFRNLKCDLREGELIKFSKNELDSLMESMKLYFESLILRLAILLGEEKA